MNFVKPAIFFIVLFYGTKLFAESQAEYLARRNAIVGLETAVGEIQKHLGADQRISVPATTVYPEKDVTRGTGPLYDDGAFGFRTHAQVSRLRTYLDLERGGTYLTPLERKQWDEELTNWWNVGVGATGGGARRNPHWTAVFDSSLRVDRASNPNATPVDIPSQQYEADPHTVYGEFYRHQLPVWLVSGNEGFDAFDPMDSTYPAGYLTPDKPLSQQGASPEDVVSIFDPGQLPEGPHALDGMVEVLRQPMGSDGHYAYWVADESVKANFTLIDPYKGAEEGSTQYKWRLGAPQGTGWEHMVGFEAAQAAGLPASLGDLPADFFAIDQLGRADTLLAAPVVANFHYLTPHSVGLFTDTALGGLKKDLTRYLEDGQGLSDADSIPDSTLYDPQDARFQAWNGSNTGFPANGSADGLPTWGQVRAWYQNTGNAGGDVTPTADTAPVLTYIKLHTGISYEPGTKTLHWHWVPAIVLWNPYDVSLSTATYDLELHTSPVLWKFNLAKLSPSLIELQQDSDADWDMRPIGPKIKPGVRQNVLSFRSHQFNPEVGGYFWPILSPDNPLYQVDYYGISSDSPDAYNIGGRGPFTYDSDFGDGTTDAAGRFYYNLKPVASMASRVKDPDMTSRTPSTYPYLYEDRMGWHGGSGNTGKNWGGGMRVAPMDALTGDTNFPPFDTPLRLRIISDFGPGESRIFSLSNPVEWDPVENTPVTLQAGFEPDFPGSLHFPVYEVVNGPSNASDLRFYGQILNNTFFSPAVKLLLNGNLIMETNAFSGDAAPNRRGGLNSEEIDPYSFWGREDEDGDGIRNSDELTNGPAFLDRWRVVYDTDYFHYDIPPYVLNTGDKRSPIWDWGEHFLTPFTARGNGTFGDVHTYTPMFSRFNAFAKHMNVHPLLDQIRDLYGPNNINANGEKEGLMKLSLFASEAPIGRPKWDNNQSSGHNGYSMITYNYMPGSAYHPLSELPVRLTHRPNSILLSLGQLQQVNLSPYVWQPAFPIGNSWAGVYNDREAIAGIHSRAPGVDRRWAAGQDPRLPQQLPNSLAFSFTGEDQYNNSLGIIEVPDNSLLDMSYVLNENIWDRYFLSTIPLNPDLDEPLPNGRHRYAASALLSPAEVTDFDLAAVHLRNFGAFNVNSTSIEAWKALLTAFRDLKLGDNPPDTAPIARTLDPIGDAIEFTFSGIDNNDIGATVNQRDYSKLLKGFRYLDDEMILALAERIVDEVRLRGPFYSVSDFINRRLIAPEGSGNYDSDWTEARTSGWSSLNPNRGYFLYMDFINPSYDPFIGLHGLTGPLQRAIDLSGINGGVNHPDFGGSGLGSGNNNDRVFTPRIRNSNNGPVDVLNSSQDYLSSNNGIGGTSNTQDKHTTEPTKRSHLDTEHLAGAPAGEAGMLMQGMPGFVTQGDLLTMIGPALTARGDTFLIRAYGDAVDPNTGLTLATARLEAVVQRSPEPVEIAAADADGIPAKWIPATSDGRKFNVVGVRWLAPDEK